MFGRSGTYRAEAPGVADKASAAILSRELIEIMSIWPDQVHEVLSRINVPVHYRQGELDALWAGGPAEVDKFRAALTSSPLVDVAMVPDTGHAIDYHRLGRITQGEQIAFAIRCAHSATARADAARPTIGVKGLADNAPVVA